MSEQDNNAPAFDMSAFEAADTATVDILTPKGEPLMVGDKAVSIEVYGPGSEQYMKATAKLNSGAQARAFAGLKGKVDKNPLETERKERAEKLAACTKQVNNFPVAPIDLYSNPKLGYITNQVARFIEDWSNFPSASSTT
jgi:hypothetical protein